MSNFVSDAYGTYPFTLAHKIVLCLLLLAFAAPYCFADDLGAPTFVGRSVAGVVVLTCLVVSGNSLALIFRGDGGVGGLGPTPVGLPSMEVVLANAPNVAFAFTSLLSFGEVFAALRKGNAELAPKRMRRSVLASSVLVLALYLLVAVTSALAFGKSAGTMAKGNGEGNVLYNFAPSN